MVNKWFSEQANRLGVSEFWNRVNVTLWNKVGPRWYVTAFWFDESLCSVQFSLLNLLAVAHAEKLEIKPLVDAFAEEHRGIHRRRLKMLAKRIESNASLVDALEKTPDALNDNAVLALRFGLQSGTLAKTYELLVETEKPRVSFANKSQNNARGYWILLAITLLLIFEGIMFFIVPTFKRTFDEFEVPMTMPLRSLLVTHEFAWAYIVVIVLACGVLRWLYQSSRIRRFVRRQFGGRIFGSNSISLSAQLFRMLSVAVEAGRPLPGSLSTLAKFHFDGKIRQRLLIARNEVEQGVPGWFSLFDAKLISKEEYQALQGAATSRVQSWTLRKFASLKLDQVESKTDARKSLIHPTVIIVFAAFLLWVSYSLFGVLTMLIQHLAK